MALLPAIRAARAGVELPASAALAAGAIAYVLTWLTGHPLLVPEALYPFFMVLGLTAAAGATPIDMAPPMRPARAAVAGTVAVILLLIGLPLRVATAIGEANLEDVGYELSGWQRDGQGERFRIAGARSTLFVPSDAGAVNLPLRRVPGKGPIEVEVLLDGRPADRVQLAGDGWKIVRLVVPTVRARYRRVDLRARATAAGEIPALMVGRVRSVYGETRDVPVPPGPARTGRTAGDYDGDGSADPAVYQQSKGVWRIEKVGTIQHGGPGDRPVPADYNGDGIVDLAVYHPSDGMWLVRGQPTLQFGEPSDIPVPGDYDGDGRIDLAVFRPSTGTWYVRNKSATAWGDPGDVPVPGDYDGDHVTELGRVPAVERHVVRAESAPDPVRGSWRRADAGRLRRQRHDRLRGVPSVFRQVVRPQAARGAVRDDRRHSGPWRLQRRPRHGPGGVQAVDWGLVCAEVVRSIR